MRPTGTSAKQWFKRLGDTIYMELHAAAVAKRLVSTSYVLGTRSIADPNDLQASRVGHNFESDAELSLGIATNDNF